MKKILVVALALAGLMPAAGTAGPPEAMKEPVANVLIITGVDRYHDWNANSEKLREMLQEVGFRVVVSEDPWVLTTPSMDTYQAIALVLNQDPRWPATVEKALVDQVNGGKALGIFHSANNCFPGWKEFEEMVGLLWRIDDVHQAGHDHYGPYTVKIVDDDHFITRGMQDFPITDELYRDLTKYSDYHVLAEAFSKDKSRDYPLIMVKTYGKGRVFHTALGHDTDSMLAEGYRRTAQRGMLWAVGLDKQ